MIRSDKEEIEELSSKYSQVPNTSNVTIIYNLAKGTPLRPY